MEWEEVTVPDSDGGETQVFVLLPPSPPSMHPLPSAVLHFVGGVLFGSAPKLFYRTLLESIVTHTQCAIVVTPLQCCTLEAIVSTLSARLFACGSVMS